MSGEARWREMVDSVRSLMDLPLTRGQAEALLAYEELLRDRAVPMGLVAAGDADRIRSRHIIDCLRAATVVGPTDETAFDVGSGAGLPGVVVSVVHPALGVTLVESRRRRAAFLELVVEELQLPNLCVAAARIEDLNDRVDLCFARAFSSLSDSWALARPLLRPGGRLVYFAGRGHRLITHVPSASAVSTVSSGLLERNGPLVIMTR